MGDGSGKVTVPPGFRFHPTDEELLYYYLKKKVSYEPIDLDVIREVNLNKLEPWDLKEKCRIGSGPENEWYLFSHKDKKYPTGTRTNRATTAGFWKATGRDKPILLPNSKKIGMRKTLVFYTGRAPHGLKTDWIMHEYRLDEDNAHTEVLEDGWVVCRVFKKKNLNRGFQRAETEEQEHLATQMTKLSGSSQHLQEPKLHLHHHHMQALYDHNYSFDGSMHLPKLYNPESAASMQDDFVECSQNLSRLTSTSGGNSGLNYHNINGDHWSFLDKLLASHHQKLLFPTHHHHHSAATCSSTQKFSFHYLGCDHQSIHHHDIMKFSK